MLQVRDDGLDEDSMHTALLIVNLDSAIDLPVSLCAYCVGLIKIAP